MSQKYDNPWNELTSVKNMNNTDTDYSDSDTESYDSDSVSARRASPFDLNWRIAIDSGTGIAGSRPVSSAISGAGSATQNLLGNRGLGNMLASGGRGLGRGTSSIARGAGGAAGGAGRLGRRGLRQAKNVTGKVAGACRKNKVLCAAGVIGIATGTAIAVDHATKSKREKQCLVWCLPKKWNDLREQVEMDEPAPDSLPNCTNASNEGPCYRTWDNLLTDPEFVDVDIPKMVEDGDFERDTQPFCTSVDYNDLKPEKGNHGGICEEFCAKKCGEYHRSFASKLAGGLGGLGKMLGGTLENILLCLEEGGTCLTKWIAIIVGVLVVLMILPMLFKS